MPQSQSHSPSKTEGSGTLELTVMAVENGPWDSNINCFGYSKQHHTWQGRPEKPNFYAWGEFSSIT